MRVISVISGKGGVGKTTITANLSATLTKFGFNVTAIDANLTTPNLGIHFGLHLADITLHDILKNAELLKKGIYIYPGGLKVIPGSLKVENIIDVDTSNLGKIISNLNSDFVFIDSAAGLGREALASLSVADEILVVTNPDIPSLTDALRAIKVAETVGKSIKGIVLNRVGRSRDELKKVDVESFLSYPVIAQVPEDPWVLRSINERKPLIFLNPNSKAAIEIQNLAFAIIGSKYRIKQSFIDKLFSWIRI
ncbi:MAG: cell division ATPase MinD [Candidatus Aenigmatarchaeota archaeon]